MPDEPFEPAEFALEFQRFLSAYQRILPPARNAFLELVSEHLGVDPRGLPSVAAALHPAEHPNLQLAIDALAAASGKWRIIGIPGDLRSFGGFSLTTLLAGRIHGMGLAPSAVEYVNVPVGVDQSLPCVQLGLWLAL